MSRKTRKIKSRKIATSSVRSRTGATHSRAWFPIGLLLFVAGLIAASQGTSTEPDNAEPATEQSRKFKPNLTRDTEVLAYIAEKNQGQSELGRSSASSGTKTPLF